MDVGKKLYITVIAIAVFVFAVKLYRVVKLHTTICEKCGGKLKLSELKDPMGVNVGNKITTSIFIGPRKYKEILVCKSCGNKTSVRYWGS